MRVWTYPEKKYEELGAERWSVTWYEKREGVPDDKEEYDFDSDLVQRYEYRKTREAALATARERWRTCDLFFGVVEVQQERVDWFVEEDRVAEWADVGDTIVIETESD